MASLGGFKATEQNTDQSSGALPIGIYALEMSASEVKKTNAGTGTFLSATFDVVEPEHFSGRKVFINYNLENPNPIAENIGKDELARLVRACGFDHDPDDSEELHFIRFTAKVGLEKEKNDGYERKNKIMLYYYPDEAEAKPFPEIGVLDEPPKGKRPAAANDNRKPAANDNRPAAGGAKKAGTPWGKK